jgi:hypothetical protein
MNTYLLIREFTLKPVKGNLPAQKGHWPHQAIMKECVIYLHLSGINNAYLLRESQKFKK